MYRPEQRERCLVQVGPPLGFEQLAQQGFDASALYRRIKSAQWKRLLPTVILTSAGQPTRRQLLIGAALWAGPG